MAVASVLRGHAEGLRSEAGDEDFDGLMSLSAGALRGGLTAASCLQRFLEGQRANKSAGSIRDLEAGMVGLPPGGDARAHDFASGKDCFVFGIRQTREILPVLVL
jgi:hypothetical protein